MKITSFSQEPNPINENQICIYEHRNKEKRLLFLIDKANFDSDADLKKFVDFLISALNNKLNA